MTHEPALGVEDAIFRFAEIYEFATRWAQAVSLAEPICREGIGGWSWAGREVGGSSDDTSRRRMEWKHTHTHSLAELVARPLVNAIAPAVSLSEMFGWDIEPDGLRDIQG